MRNNRTIYPLAYSDVLTRDFLEKEYIHNKKSIAEISKELNIYRETVARYIRMHGFIVRTTKEQMGISYPSKEVILSTEVKSFIDGLLSGDASIPKKKDFTAPRNLTQTCKYEEYLQYVSRRLNHFCITCSPLLSRWSEDVRCKSGGYHECFLQTHRYQTFEIFRRRRYPLGKKIIPRDLIITSDLLLQLYLCDGNFYRHILLCTNGFDKEDVLFLKNLIEKELQITLRLVDSKSGFMLAINKSVCNIFLDYIGPCPVKCYEYKWTDNESEEAKIRKNLNARISYHRRQNAKKENICGAVS